MALWVTDKKLDRFLSEAKKFHYSKTIYLPGRVAMANKVTREKSTQPNQTWHRTYSGKDAAPLFKPKHSEDSCFCFKPQLNRNLPKFYNSGSNSNKTPSAVIFFKFQASNLWQEIQKCKLSAWIVVLSNSLLSGMENRDGSGWNGIRKLKVWLEEVLISQHNKAYCHIFRGRVLD